MQGSEVYEVQLHEILCSTSSNYEVLQFLGSGTYGQVVKCWKWGTNETVAIKILKTDPSYAQQGCTEASILRQLKIENAHWFNIVQSDGSFLHRNHLCLVFEMLHESLRKFMLRRNFIPLSLKSIRPIVQQVATALVKLKSLCLIHADLKPDNIMLVDPVKQPYRVKIIDFSLACYTSQAQCSARLQTRFYRSPEIMLGLPFCEAIDMWSLGCIMAELFLGYPLYPGPSEYDQIRYICETQGPPAQHLLNAGTKTTCFFLRDSTEDGSFWRLKTPAEYEAETSILSEEYRLCYFRCLQDIASGFVRSYVESLDLSVESGDRIVFTDLLQKMLSLEADMRITPWEVLRHPFITMCHLLLAGPSAYVTSSFQRMEICDSMSSTIHNYRKEVQQPVHSFQEMQGHSSLWHQPTCFMTGTSHSHMLQENFYISSVLPTYPCAECTTYAPGWSTFHFTLPQVPVMYGPQHQSESAAVERHRPDGIDILDIAL